ncbi:hypothetical protein GCK32_016862, partial [Trichostrongylus colubriformis]
MNGGKLEVIYDAVAEDPKHIYDTVADSGLHHAHGALVVSEPVKRPLAVSPPVSDDLNREPIPEIEVLHYAERDLSKHRTYYDDDEHIYEEIGSASSAPPKIGEGVSETKRVTEHIYEVPSTPSKIEQGVTDTRESATSHYAVSLNIGEGAEDSRKVTEHVYE